jgi:flagellar motor switch protein FliN/FliY
MTGSAALAHLGDATAAAALGALEHLAPAQLDGRDVRILSGEGDPFDGLAAPLVTVSAGYADGAGGTNVLAMPAEAARRLAGGSGSGEISDAERSALEEAAGQILSSAAATLSAMLDTPMERGPLQTRTFASPAELPGSFPATPHAVAIAFTFGGDPCRLVQLVPNALVVRLSDALHEIGATPPRSSDADPGSERRGRPSLDGIPVRVWAELGRTRLPSEQFVGLPAGAVVELDHHPDDPIDLFVNGRRFATGRLLVVDDAEWAVRIETVLPRTDTTSQAGEGSR